MASGSAALASALSTASSLAASAFAGPSTEPPPSSSASSSASASTSARDALARAGSPEALLPALAASAGGGPTAPITSASRVLEVALCELKAGRADAALAAYARLTMRLAMAPEAAAARAAALLRRVGGRGRAFALALGSTARMNSLCGSGSAPPARATLFSPPFFSPLSIAPPRDSRVSEPATCESPRFAGSLPNSLEGFAAPRRVESEA